MMFTIFVYFIFSPSFDRTKDVVSVQITLLKPQFSLRNLHGIHKIRLREKFISALFTIAPTCISPYSIRVYAPRIFLFQSYRLSIKAPDRLSPLSGTDRVNPCRHIDTVLTDKYKPYPCVRPLRWQWLFRTEIPQWKSDSVRNNCRIPRY